MSRRGLSWREAVTVAIVGVTAVVLAALLEDPARLIVQSLIVLAAVVLVIRLANQRVDTNGDT
jgi:hypothetical protein